MRFGAVKLLLAILCSIPALAQGASDFPSQAVKLIVGYAAGGSADVVARIFAQELSKELGQTVVVENRGGASGVVGAQAVIGAAPDGHILYFVASPTVTLTPAIQRVSFDPLSDFTPIAALVNYVSVLMVNAESPYKTVGDIVEYAKKNPGSVTFGSSGVGSASHIAGEMLAEMAGVQFTHVPYKGNAPALTDLMAGRLTFVFDLTTTAMSNVQSGKLRALAVTSSERNPSFPEVPTMVEAGFKDFTYAAWFGLLGPANMPISMVNKLAEATRKIANKKSFKDRMIQSGYIMTDETTDGLRERMRQEGQMFKDLVARIHLARK
ncbi:Bug family tripartite tricarboxylate transporter substrate binding protein [Candidimonas nitroreducens]|uniref:ABC transporter substrate-binding protein n=1 Tax=Candidimonas nitroreducens TaxID=683354 RepID=A0A225MG12_9BURK|nr:tripartite tricarboxylate transporter substrate binding protein [Candidimonas nitroreducens]OWT60195.1 hypothetical protein CEY11_11050 [Candidimonas nitroreducens]